MTALSLLSDENVQNLIVVIVEYPKKHLIEHIKRVNCMISELNFNRTVFKIN